MKYNRILVISDNLNLCLTFKDILDRKFKNSIAATFSISPFSNQETFEDQLETKVFVYDLKKEESIEEILLKYDLIFSIHCKQLFPPKLVNGVKCINVHPGYNPINRGWYPQVFSIINDLPIGATIHEIDEKLDNGHIIARQFVDKKLSDTSKDVYDRVVQKEVELLENHIESILNGHYSLIQPEQEGNLFLKKDFNKLCAIDLTEKVTMLEAINRLRALTHGDFKNAYFIDEDSGKKVYVKIELSDE